MSTRDEAEVRASWIKQGQAEERARIRRRIKKLQGNEVVLRKSVGAIIEGDDPDE